MTDEPIQRDMTMDMPDGLQKKLTASFFAACARDVARQTKACNNGLDLLVLVAQGPDFVSKLGSDAGPGNGVLVFGDGRANLYACCMILNALIKSGQTNDERVQWLYDGCAALLKEHSRR